MKKFLDIKTMSLKDDSMEIKIMIEGTGCLKNHENEQQGPLSKNRFSLGTLQFLDIRTTRPAPTPHRVLVCVGGQCQICCIHIGFIELECTKT